MKATTRLAAVLSISIAFFCVEIAIGFRTKSLALVADAFHYLNDIVAYAIAFLASYVQEKEYRPPGFTYALHRAELVGAFFNGVFLLALALSIFLQSLERFINIEPVIDPLSMLIVGCVGLTLNLLSAGIVHDHHGHSHGNGHGHGIDPAPSSVDAHVVDLPDEHEEVDAVALERTRGRNSFSVANEEQHLGDIHADHNHSRSPPRSAPNVNLGMAAVLIHVLGDAVNNVGVIIAAAIIWQTHSPARFYADPAVSLFISLIIFASAVPLTLKSGRILLEASPIHLDLDHITEDLLALQSVKSIHDLHVWQLSHKVIVASMHVEVPSGTTLVQWEKIEGCLRECMAAYGVTHVTVGPEVIAVAGRSEEGVGGPNGRKGFCHGEGLLGCSGTVVGSGQSLRRRVE